MKISILTPSYNSENYIENAIKSVLCQNYNNYEHIIIDGGSTDNTIDILNKYPHLIWKSQKDKGQSDAMNKAFALSTGDIIGYLNVDDWYETDVFSFVADFFKNNPECDALVGVIEMHFENNQIMHIKSDYQYENVCLHFKYGFPNNPVGYFYRRHVQKKIGKFPLKNHFTMDYWFILHLYKKFKVFSTNNIFGHYLLTGTNKTSTINPVKACRKTFLNFALKNDIRGYFIYQFKYIQYFKNKNLLFRILRKCKEFLS
jgi:glycosyltransferase involved in cell wall biosynthesis